MKTLILSAIAFLFCFSSKATERRLEFSPQIHGFHFPNNFHNHTDFGYTDGLCGGMVLAAFNYFRYRMPIPALTGKQIDYNVEVHLGTVTTSGTTSLIDYIFHSQVATYTNVSIASFAGIADPAYEAEFNKAQARIDRGEYLILGLKSRDGQKGLGHQVLCYGYNSTSRELYVYDPNHPNYETVISPSNATNGQNTIDVKVQGQIVDPFYKAIFEEQELFPDRTSERTSYDAVDNVLRSLNYAVRPPETQNSTIAVGIISTAKIPINYDRDLPPQDLYRFQNLSSLKTVEVEDGVFNKGTKVQQYFSYERNGIVDGHNQEWLLIPAGMRGDEKVFYIINNGFLKYLEAGSGVSVEEGNSSDNQLWFLESTGAANVYLIKSVSNNTYLEVPSGSANDGDALVLNQRTSASNQQFAFTKIVGLTGPPDQRTSRFFNILPSYNDQKFLNLPGSNTDNGTSITIWDGNPGITNLQWEFTRDDQGYYEIKPQPANGAKSLSVAYASMDNGANITLYDCVHADNQKWIIIPVVREPGKFIFFNKNSGRCINVAGGNVSTNNTPVQQYKYLNQDNLKWLIRPIQ